ncbi:hypothetical protein HW555_005973 [Spodoptera exigua]|uniref:Uncharacterized protein n=1 Tax=Spodoptera exigua TaxID=7107 RepID=A0A835GI58_SPOEX|nr:hypothetical protein HW555_005973 [Spodoptera exigua]
MFRFTVILWVVLGICKSAPMDEFNGFINQGELSVNPDGDLMGIVPGYLPQGSQKSDLFSGLLELNSDYINLKEFVKKGGSLKGLIFNIYNDEMKDVASHLFELLHNAERSGYDIDKLINLKEFNDDLVTYVSQINSLYRDKYAGVDVYPPPFTTKPHYFVNGETIIKALKLVNYINNNIDITDNAHVDQYFKTYDILTINTNYSGWNLPENGGEELLNYFREDIGLNSYYYGVQLMHPFWMFRHRLYTSNSRPDEHYYYIHQQLAARLYLEKEHLRQENGTKKTEFGDYHPYLIYENGLPFPTRSGTMGDWNEDRAKIKTIDIAIRECMSRGLIVMDNKPPIKLSEENYVKLLTRLFRGNFEVGKVSKIIRSFFGYGGNGYPIEGYNPAPSLLHHPETTLRDPVYWYMMQYVLNYFTEFKESIEPADIQKDAIKQCEIIDADIPKITTYFNYYQFDISNAVFKLDSLQDRMPLTITARQKRLKHSKFEFNFTVDCKGVKDSIVRLFLGPPCTDSCWEEYANFFELDKFAFALAEEGLSTITWSPEISTRFSNDEYYNLEGSSTQSERQNNFNLFKFPENLIIPRGTPNGLNLTLFIMITPADEYLDEIYSGNKFFGEIMNDLDNKPIGYPFDRPAVGYYDDAPNYKFYNITIYHKKNHIPKNSYFSPHLH